MNYFLIFALMILFVSLTSADNIAGKSVTHTTRNDNCGVPHRLRGNISGGRGFPRGSFPWMVALLYDDSVNEPKYFCGGSLISLKHILTGKVFILQ